MKRTTMTLLAVALTLGMTAQTNEKSYARYYKGLPVEVKAVARPAIPANVVSLKDVGGVADASTKPTTKRRPSTCARQLRT